MSYRKDQVIKQRKHLESCLISRQIEPIMASNSNSYATTTVATKLKGFGKKILNTDFVALKIKGRLIYVQQRLKNSFSRKKLLFILKRLLTRKLFQVTGFTGFSFIIFLNPRKSLAADWGDQPLELPAGWDPITNTPSMSRSEVSCDLVAQSWYRACTSYKNLYGKPSASRRLDCAAHTLWSCAVTFGVGCSMAGSCLQERDYQWTGAALIGGGSLLALGSSRAQEAHMYWTMQDWCDCGLGPEKGITCPTSWGDAREFIGSKSWWREATDFFKYAKANPGFTDMSDETLNLTEEALKAAVNNGTIPFFDL
jgi:hypothetical protein